MLPDDVARFVRAAGPGHDEVQAEMAAHAEERGFPIIGPEVGGVLRLLARLTDATSVFEFGSGFGYSAYWFLRGMPEGRVVLTEHDPDELDMAREFLARGGFADRAAFEEGDAVELVESYDGPFDLVLIDHQKRRYPEAFERVRGKVAVGGVVVADNLMRGPADFDALLAYLEGAEVDLDDTNESTRGLAAYLGILRAAPDFETVVLPMGNGVTVSIRVE